MCVCTCACVGKSVLWIDPESSRGPVSAVSSTNQTSHQVVCCVASRIFLVVLRIFLVVSRIFSVASRIFLVVSDPTSFTSC